MEKSLPLEKGNNHKNLFFTIARAGAFAGAMTLAGQLPAIRPASAATPQAECAINVQGPKSELVLQMRGSGFAKYSILVAERLSPDSRQLAFSSIVYRGNGNIYVYYDGALQGRKTGFNDKAIFLRNMQVEYVGISDVAFTQKEISAYYKKGSVKLEDGDQKALKYRWPEKPNPRTFKQCYSNDIPYLKGFKINIVFMPPR